MDCKRLDEIQRRADKYVEPIGTYVHELVSEVRRLNACEGELIKALRHLDKVFQQSAENPTPILPGFVRIGGSKFEAIEDLARVYLELKSENERLKADKTALVVVLDDIGGLSRALRVGGPDSMDLEGLSHALTAAVDMAHVAIAKHEKDN